MTYQPMKEIHPIPGSPPVTPEIFLSCSTPKSLPVTRALLCSVTGSTDPSNSYQLTQNTGQNTSQESSLIYGTAARDLLGGSERRGLYE